MKRIVLALVAAVLAAASVSGSALAQKSKDTLRIPLADGETALDAYLLPGSFNNVWEPSVFDNLLGFDPKEGDFAPLLAKSWSHPEPSIYEYVLRDDLKWHDGQKVTADDVVYTIDYLIDPKVKLRFKSSWNWVKSVEKLGPLKIRITSKSPVPDGMMWMAFNTPIFPKHLHEPLADKQQFGANPVGTGPLRVIKLDRNAGILAEKNPDFKSMPTKQAATIGKFIAEPIPDPGTLVAKFMVGEVDVARDVSGDQVQALIDSGKAEFTLSPPALGYSFIGFPSVGWQNVKALGDPRVRLAIIKAIDRKALVVAQYGQIGKDIEPVEGLCSKEQLGCGYTKLTPEYDPAGAKKLLAEAGYADGFDVGVSTFPSGMGEATAISGMLRAVGIRASVRPHGTAARLQQMAQGRVDIGYYGWNGGGMFEVSGQLVRHFLTKEYDDPVLVKMAEDTTTMMNDAERRVAVAKVMDYANERSYLFPMSPNRVIFTHTKEVKLNASGLRTGQVNPHEFGWK
jgi:peptide/nickel transport system substrate-binding protein